MVDSHIQLRQVARLFEALFLVRLAYSATIYDIYGEITIETSVYIAANTRSRYSALCFSGHSTFQTGTCYHATGKLQGDGYLPFDTEAMNSIDTIICLQCCSGNLCHDDDYDDGTGECQQGGYNDKWRLRCQVADAGDLRQISRQDLRRQQVRLLRNLDPGDTHITACPIPRYGFTYAKCEVGNGPKCTKVVDDTSEDIVCDESTCDGDGCRCTVPRDYFVRSGSVRDSMYFLGYELELWISDEKNDDLQWRAVRDCRVTGLEYSIKSSKFDPFDTGQPVYFIQDFYLRSKYEFDFFDDQTIKYTLGVIALGSILLCYISIYSCNARCMICKKLTVTCTERCLMCRLCGAELPDEHILQELRRRRMSDRGLCPFLLRHGGISGIILRLFKVIKVRKGSTVSPTTGRVVDVKPSPRVASRNGQTPRI